MYKVIKKNPDDSWDNISRRIFGTPEHSGDFEKINCNTLGDEVVVFEQEENTDSQNLNDGVYIEVDGTVYKDFSEYTLIDRLGAIKAGVFIFLCSETNINSLKLNQSVNVYDENGLFLTGRIANIKAVKNKNTTHLQLEIKSSAGVLIESLVPYPLDFLNQSVQAILTTLAGYFGLRIEFEESNITQEITSFSAEVDETVFQFMNRVCYSRGLVLKDTGICLKVFKLDTKIEEKINFIENECVGIESIRGSFIGDNLARYYEVSSQYPEANITVVTTPYTLPVTKRLISNDINASNINETAQQLVCRELGKHFKLNVALNDNFSIKSGDIAIVKQKAVQILKETDFVIEEVNRMNPDILKLSLTLPCVYTGILPETLPLC